MDRIDAEEFGKDLVLALAGSGKIRDTRDAVEEYERFMNAMVTRGNIDPDEDDEDDDDYDDEDEDDDDM